MIIDTSYFINEIQVLSKHDEKLNRFILKYEREAIEMGIGYTEYLNLKTAIYAGPLVEEWEALVNGHMYTYNGMNMYWPGMVSDDCESYLAHYVFYYFKKDEITYTTGEGEIDPMAQNSGRMSSYAKAYQAKNHFSEVNGECSTTCVGKQTLISFLTHMKDLNGWYPDFVHTYVEPENVYGI